MENSEIQGSLQERRLYDLIWKRTTASQMADAQMQIMAQQGEDSEEDVEVLEENIDDN